jgi:hypothetical protein
MLCMLRQRERSRSQSTCQQDRACSSALFVIPPSAFEMFLRHRLRSASWTWTQMLYCIGQLDKEGIDQHQNLVGIFHLDKAAGGWNPLDSDFLWDKAFWSRQYHLGRSIQQGRRQGPLACRELTISIDYGSHWHRKGITCLGCGDKAANQDKNTSTMQSTHYTGIWNNDPTIYRVKLGIKSEFMTLLHLS